MKIAVLSDVHGNVPALRAVLDDIGRWRPDEVIVNGDLVSRGPYSVACLDLLQAAYPRARLLTGNHETYVLHCVDQPPDPAAPTWELTRFATWTARQLGPERVAALRVWGDHVDLTGLEGGSSFHITHGSRLGNRDGIYPETTDDVLAAKLGAPRDLFVASHTHRAFVRRHEERLIANTGSVGQPMDGDERAAWGRFEFQRGTWQAQIARVAYDKAQAECDFEESGFLADCGPIAQLIFRELRDARSHVAWWRIRYFDAVRRGDISVAAAVDSYLASL